MIDHELLMPDTVSMIRETSWLLNDGEVGLGFGLGVFSVASKGDIVKLGHSGSTAGGMSHVYYYPKIDAYIVLLTNTLIVDNIELLEAWGANILIEEGNGTVMAKIEQLIGVE